MDLEWEMHGAVFLVYSRQLGLLTAVLTKKTRAPDYWVADKTGWGQVPMPAFIKHVFKMYSAQDLPGLTTILHARTCMSCVSVKCVDMPAGPRFPAILPLL